MIIRQYWIKKIEDAWEKRSLVWLAGVRRTGKTTLSKMIPGINYLNCDLPSVGHQLEDPEFFYYNTEQPVVVFDEIHRLDKPDIILKIGTDEFNYLRILATGSSTLTANSKFRDSLTGRKIQLFFPPVLWNECTNDFGIKNLDRRLLLGGLPEFLLRQQKDDLLYSEWIDSYYARDIQELFNIKNKTGFLKLFNLLLFQSGSTFEITSLAKQSGLSRPTVMSHIEALQVANAIHIVKPFSGKGKKEIIRQPKIYAFDTGFVTYVKRLTTITDNERGILWEHLVLDMLKVGFGDVLHWRDKNKHEVDFILRGKENKVIAIECKINPSKFSPKGIIAFRKLYPQGKNYCFSPYVPNGYKLRFNNIIVEFVSSADQINNQV